METTWARIEEVVRQVSIPSLLSTLLVLNIHTQASKDLEDLKHLAPSIHQQ
jgi:hypothetical protein